MVQCFVLGNGVRYEDVDAISFGFRSLYFVLRFCGCSVGEGKIYAEVAGAIEDRAL